MNARMKWSLGAAVLAVVAAVLLLGTDDPTAGQTGPKYKDVTAERGLFRIAVSANGLVRPIDRIELKSKASGAVVKLPIEVGIGLRSTSPGPPLSPGLTLVSVIRRAGSRPRRGQPDSLPDR